MSGLPASQGLLRALGRELLKGEAAFSALWAGMHKLQRAENAGGFRMNERAEDLENEMMVIEEKSGKINQPTKKLCFGHF